MQTFSPAVTQPMKLADKLVTRFLETGQLMEGVEAQPVDSALSENLAESYELGWVEAARVDNGPADLDARPGFLHTRQGRFESFEEYRGSAAGGATSTVHVTHSHEGEEIESVDRRELRATAQGWDYVAVAVRSNGNVDALATHVDRATRQATEQSWYLRL